MSIESSVKAIIEKRRNNFYDLLDEFKEEGELCFPNSMEPDFDFIEKYDTDGNPVFTDAAAAKAYNTKLARFKALSVRLEANAGLYYTDDESSAFFGCSYDEILGMANNGVSIPDEVLNWAYAMAEANPSEPTETADDSSEAQTLFNALKQNPSLNIKTITKIFVNKCVEQSDELEAYLDELAPIEKEMETARVEAETKKNESLNKIKNLTKEWNTLQNKLQSGDTLSNEEKARFEELQELFTEEDKNYQKTIDKTTKNFLAINERMSFIGGKANTTYDFGTQTIEAARELAEYEKTHKSGRTILGGLISSGLVNMPAITGIIGVKNFSETAHTVGVNTQYFSDDVTSVLQEVQVLMQATADTAGFDINDPSYTVEPLSTDESLDEPAVNAPAENAPAASDGLSVDEENEAPVGEASETDTTEETSTETEETTEVEASADEKTDEELLADGEANLEEVDAKALSMPGIKRLVKEEGVDTEKKGKEALKLVDQLKSQSAVVNEKEAEVQEKTTEVKETSEENESTEGTDNSDNEDAMTEAQTGAEESQNDLDAATEAESLTIEGLRETFKASTKTNQKYSKDVDIAQDKMQESLRLGALTAAGGSTLTGLGVYNVIQGNVILSTAWLNPFAAALGIYMINMGTSEIAIGNIMITGATALSMSAVEGIEINEETTEKLGISNEDITTATENLDEFERQQTEEVEQEGTDSADESDDTAAPSEDDLRNKDEQLLVDMNTQDNTLSGLKPIVSADGKSSTVLGIENVKATKELEPQIPQITEEAIAVARAKRDKEAEEAASNQQTETQSEVQAQTQSKDIVEGSEAVEEDKKEKETIFDQYHNDFAQDKAKNAEYSEDIKTSGSETNTGFNLGGQGVGAGTARTSLGLGEIATGTMLLTQWFNPMAIKLGLELIKLGQADTALGGQLLGSGLSLTANSAATLATNAIASERVQDSNKRTDESNDKVTEMETEVNKVVEEQLKADEEEAEKAQESENEQKSEDKKEEEELTPENAADSVANAEDEEKNAEQENKSNEKIEKKTRKEIKKNDKKLKKSDKQAKKSDKEAQIQNKTGLENGKLGEEEAQNTNPDSAQSAAEQTSNELAETESISAEVTEIVAEVQDDVAEVQRATTEANAENEAIVAEMNTLNMELQQDQTQLTSIDNQIKQEEQKNNSGSAQPAPQPVPQAQPAAPKKPVKTPKPEPENDDKNVEAEPTDNKPAQPAPMQAPQAKAPVQQATQEEIPEGSDKIQYSSDKEKQPAFVGFIAQSDSLASGSVFASSQPQNAPVAQNNQQGSGAGLMTLKNTQNNKKANKKNNKKQQSTQATGTAVPAQQQEEKTIIAANRTTQKPFDINSMSGGADKTQGLRQSAQAIRTAAFNKQAKLSAMAVRAQNNAMERIAEEARIQAEAARKQRLAQEKQERIEKIKAYAGLVQTVGGLTTTAGMIVTKVGTAQAAAGTAQVTAGTTQVTAGAMQVMTGTLQVTAGTTMVTTGTAQITTGTAQITAGSAQVASGTTMTTTGTTMIATGSAMLSNPFTAAAGAALVASGTSLVSSGSALITTGSTMIATGTLQQVAGNISVTSGTTTIAAGNAQSAAGNTQITAGGLQITAGTAQVTSGTALAATGATIQTIGTIVTAAGAATSAGADIANGNILGGITSIVGAAGSVVGVAAPVSQLGNAAIQLGSQGAALAGQLATANAGQDNGVNQQQKKKKKQFKQNTRTEGIMAKAAQNQQAVKNRFNK